MQIYHKTSHRYAETDSNLTSPDISLLVFEAFEPVLWKSETIFVEKSNHYSAEVQRLLRKKISMDSEVCVAPLAEMLYFWSCY